MKRFHLIGKAYNGVSLSELMEGHVNGYNGKPIDFALDMLNLYKTNQTLFAQKVLVEILNVLDFLHGHGVTKGCIDPDYIILTDKREILFSMLDLYEWHCLKLGFYDQRVHPHFNICSLIGCMSFEQEFLTDPMIIYGFYLNDNRTDVYSAAALFELMAGADPHHPHNDDASKVIMNKELRKVIRRATDRNPNNRYQTIGVFYKLNC